MGDHRLVKFQKGMKSIQIETIKLDDFLSDLNHIDLIMMVIQGAEYLAFVGMEGLIKKSKKLRIICEFCPSSLQQFGYSATQFLERTLEYEFEIQRIDDRKKR